MNNKYIQIGYSILIKNFIGLNNLYGYSNKLNYLKILFYQRKYLSYLIKCINNNLLILLVGIIVVKQV